MPIDTDTHYPFFAFLSVAKFEVILPVARERSRERNERRRRIRLNRHRDRAKE